jgi:hypothetical protein
MIFFKRKDKNIDSKMTKFKDFVFSSYLSPWYFKDSTPNLGQNLNWKHSSDSGMIKLMNNKDCLGLIDTYCYLKPINNEYFLFWVRGTTKIELYKSQDLQPIQKEIDIIKNLKDSKQKYYFNCAPIDKIEYFFDLYQTELTYNFPETFKSIDEIIQVNDINGMYRDFKDGTHNTAIVSLQPKYSKIILYPQDWFNRDDTIDFGYQWITRADRNNRTGKIHIQGIRIDEYILDDTNRQIIK